MITFINYRIIKYLIINWKEVFSDTHLILGFVTLSII